VRGGAILAAVSTPLNKLDRAFEAARVALGPDYLRRLRDYQRLLESDPVVRESVERITSEVESATADLDRDDEQRLAELVRLRRELAEREPSVDDGGRPRPQGSVLDRGMSEERRVWMWSLSNFDAIAENGDDKLIERRGLDGSAVRMLGEILNAKIYNLQYPGGQQQAPARPDLDDLSSAVNRTREQHRAQQQRLEERTETSGFLASRRVALLVSYLQPYEVAGETSEDEDRERAEAVLLEVSGDFHHLREAVRPEEARGSLTADQQAAVKSYEEKSRPYLATLHNALRSRVEAVEIDRAPSGWKGLDTSQKIQVAGIVAASMIGIAAIVVTVAVATA
jgi:hypothetical protein